VARDREASAFGFMPPGQFFSLTVRMRRNLGATPPPQGLIYSPDRLQPR